MMKLLRQLPFESEYDNQRLNCGLWQSEENECEYQNDPPGVCDPSGYYYGTLDGREPKFCARHFYQNVTRGDPEAPYELADRK